MPEQRFCERCGTPIASAAKPSLTKPPQAAEMSVARIAIGVVVGVGLVWVFLPGLLTPNSSSPLYNEDRRSPLVNMIREPQVLEKDANLKEDEFGGPSFEIKTASNIKLEVEHVSGPPLDIYLVTKDGFDAYADAAQRLSGGRFSHVEGFEGIVKAGRKFEQSGRLAAGQYVVLLDNTDSGKVSPPMNMSDDGAKARVKLTID
jgi:hypothetical protein